ncbi:MAG: hypothetical protein ACKO5C_03140 [Ferruginibacter sp.]
MTKQLPLLFAFILFFTTAFAQTKTQSGAVNDTTLETKKRNKNKPGNARRAELQLSAEQEASFKAASHELRTCNQRIEADSTLTTQQKKQKRKEARQAYIQKLSTFLSPEQLDKVKAYRKKEDE